MVTPITPSRNQLARIAQNDPELIRAFELLFTSQGDVVPEDISALRSLIDGLQVDVANADLASIAAANLATSYRPSSALYDYIDMAKSAPHADMVRRIGWNDQDETLNIGMEYGVNQQVGMETYARVNNGTGSTIPNGQFVGFAGASAEGISVAPYLADGSSPSLYGLGVMTHDLSDGSSGYCTTFGYVRDVDTSAFGVGQLLYASPAIAGGLTAIKPTAPNNVIPVAACMVSDAESGVIFVRPTIEQMQYYGVFSKTSDQSPALINTAYAITFDNTEIGNGVSIGSPSSRIVVPASGLYQLDANIQVTSGNSSKKDVYFWYRKNGVDVANSARVVTNDVSNGFLTLTLINTISLGASDFIEVMFAANDTNVTIDNMPATAFSPAAPSVVLNVTQVHQ